MREKFERKIKEKKRAKSFSTVGAFNLRVLDFLITRQIDKQAGMGRGLKVLSLAERILLICLLMMMLPNLWAQPTQCW